MNDGGNWVSAGPSAMEIMGDHWLSIMASSVLNKWAFSSAGITISKWHNHLNADIVEALQGLKSLIQQDLMVRVATTVADKEKDLNYDNNQPANQDSMPMELVHADDEVSWGAPMSDECKGIPNVGGHDTDIDIE